MSCSNGNSGCDQIQGHLQWLTQLETEIRAQLETEISGLNLMETGSSQGCGHETIVIYVCINWNLLKPKGWLNLHNTHTHTHTHITQANASCILVSPDISLRVPIDLILCAS